MPTVIRFARHGTKKKPYFRIVVQDKTAARDGKFIEHIGAFIPQKGDCSLVVKRERLEYWLGTGAQMSDSIRNRLRLRMREWKGGEVATSPKGPAASKEKKKEKAEAIAK